MDKSELLLDGIQLDTADAAPVRTAQVQVGVERWPLSYASADVVLAQIAPLIVDFIVETGEAKDGKVRPPNFGIIMQLWEKGLLQLALARIDGKIKGWRMATFQADPILNMNVVSMRGLYVDPEFRGMGIGKRLNNVMMARAMSENAHLVMATAETGSAMEKLLMGHRFERISNVYRRRI